MRFIALQFLVFVAVVSCTNTTDNSFEKMLQGNWVCTEGTLNGENAELMIFNESEGNLGANLIIKDDQIEFPVLSDLGKEVKQSFTIKGKELHASFNKDLIYQVTAISENQMTLEFTITAEDQKFEFNLIFTRKEALRSKK